MFVALRGAQVKYIGCMYVPGLYVSLNVHLLGETVCDAHRYPRYL